MRNQWDSLFTIPRRTIKNLGEITVWPPRKQRPVRVCFIFFASQITNPRFPKEPVWFGASFVPARSAPLHTPPAQSLPVPPTVLLSFSTAWLCPPALRLQPPR
ncbi:hypothetical protein K5549_006135 [Capra hircus]|nr:hypothetical protein K5549_006135 [Capra hircus]